MQIVIDIPEEVYKVYKLNSNLSFLNSDQQSFARGHLINGLVNGTPLSKDHGDLIDRDDLLADSYCIDDWSGNEVNIVDVMTVKMADAIIEADKAESKEI